MKNSPDELIQDTIFGLQYFFYVDYFLSAKVPFQAWIIQNVTSLFK